MCYSLYVLHTTHYAWKVDLDQLRPEFLQTIMGDFATGEDPLSEFRTSNLGAGRQLRPRGGGGGGSLEDMSIESQVSR